MLYQKWLSDIFVTQTKGERAYIYLWLKAIRKTKDRPTIVTIKEFFRIISGSKVKVLKGYTSVASLMNTWNNGWPNLEPRGNGRSLKVTQNISVNFRMMISFKLHLSYGSSFNFEIVYFKHGAYRPRPYIQIGQCNIYWSGFYSFVKPGSVGFLRVLDRAYCRLIEWKNIKL